MSCDANTLLYLGLQLHLTNLYGFLIPNCVCNDSISSLKTSKINTHNGSVSASVTYGKYWNLQNINLNSC